jgi:hypothetical protein
MKEIFLEMIHAMIAEKEETIEEVIEAIEEMIEVIEEIEATEEIEVIEEEATEMMMDLKKEKVFLVNI